MASVPELLSNPQAYDGHRVLVPAIVQQRVNDRTVLVGPNKNQELAVRLPDNNTNANVSPGEQVQISATVARPAQEQQLEQNLGLNRDEARRVENSGVMLEAYAINPENTNGQNGNGNVNGNGNGNNGNGGNYSNNGNSGTNNQVNR